MYFLYWTSVNDASSRTSMVQKGPIIIIIMSVGGIFGFHVNPEITFLQRWIDIYKDNINVSFILYVKKELECTQRSSTWPRS